MHGRDREEVLLGRWWEVVHSDGDREAMSPLPSSKSLDRECTFWVTCHPQRANPQSLGGSGELALLCFFLMLVHTILIKGPIIFSLYSETRKMPLV